MRALHSEDTAEEIGARNNERFRQARLNPNRRNRLETDPHPRFQASPPVADRLNSLRESSLGSHGTKHYGVNTGGHDQVHRAAINQQYQSANSNQVPAKRRIANHNRNRTAEIRRYQDARTFSRRGLAPPA